MRVRITRSWSDVDMECELESHIVDELTYGGEGGELEDIKDNINLTANAIARLCNTLLDKGLLTLDEVNEMIGERYNVEEVEG